MRAVFGIGAAMMVLAVGAPSAQAAGIPPLSNTFFQSYPQQNMILMREGMYERNVKSAIDRRSGASGTTAQGATKGADKGREVAPEDGPVDDSVLVFKSTPTVSERARQELTEQVSRTQGPDVAKRFKEALAQADLVGDFGRRLAKSGYSAGNFGDVMTGYCVMSWETVSGKQATLAQIKGADAQLKRSLVRSGRIAKLTDAEKQLAAELLIYQALFAQQRERDLQQQRRLSELVDFHSAVSESVRRLGLDFRFVTLTERGFERHRH